MGSWESLRITIATVLGTAGVVPASLKPFLYFVALPGRKSTHFIADMIPRKNVHLWFLTMRHLSESIHKRVAESEVKYEDDKEVLWLSFSSNWLCLS